MKANEAPKSKFVYPDKLYVRCKDNKTLDISYAPQNMEAVEYVQTDVFIEKILDYIENNIYDHYDGDHEYGICGGYVKKKEFIDNFRKYIEGE